MATSDIAIGQMMYVDGMLIRRGCQRLDVPWDSVREVAYAMLVAAERHDKGERLPEIGL